MLWVRPSDTKTVQRGGESKEMDQPQHDETFQAGNCFTECTFNIISIHSSEVQATTQQKNIHKICTASLDGRQVKWLVYVILCVDKDCQV